MHMINKQSIRERRHNRIRAILERGETSSRRFDVNQEGPTASSSFSEQERETRLLFGDPPSEDSRLNDPEYMWKQRQRELRGLGVEDELTSPGLWTARLIASKFIICALLFAVVWGVFQLEKPWAIKAQESIRQTMTDEFDFAALDAWYQKHFRGFPSFIPAMNRDKGTMPQTQSVDSSKLQTLHRPVVGRVEQPFSQNLPGVVLRTAKGADVVNIGTGRVIYVGRTEQTELTVIIQHGGELRSVYGKLASTELEKDDWIEGGESIGVASSSQELTDGQLYFSIKQGDIYLDPAEVMAFE